MNDDYDVINEGDVLTNNGLPELTQRQYNYVLNLSKGMTSTDAYIQAYEREDITRQTAAQYSYKVKYNPSVQAWLKAIERDKLTQATYTKDKHLQELDELAQEAKQTGNYGAAVTAVVNKGKAAGHYQDKPVMQGEISGADALFAWITERTAQLEADVPALQEDNTKH